MEKMDNVTEPSHFAKVDISNASDNERFGKLASALGYAIGFCH